MKLLCRQFMQKCKNAKLQNLFAEGISHAHMLLVSIVVRILRSVTLDLPMRPAGTVLQVEGSGSKHLLLLLLKTLAYVNTMFVAS